MEDAGRAFLADAQVPAGRQALLRQADLRYRRQAYELTLPIADGPITCGTLDRLAADFHAKHEQTYGHANREEPVQLVNLRLTAVGRLPMAPFAQTPDPGRVGETSRDVWFMETGFVRVPVLWRGGLVPGIALDGPMVIEAVDSTVVLPRGWRAAVDVAGFIRMTWAAGG